MRQGLLSEPQASSGPAAMLLAVSRSPSSIPRRSPCPERCHLPLASLNHIHLSKPQKHPRLHPLPERCLLPLASLNHIHLSKTQKHPRLHPPPEQCHLPLASLSILLTKPQKHPRLHPPSDATFLWRPSQSTPQSRPPDRCHLPLASLSIPTKKTAPGSSNTARHRNQNTRQTDLYNI